MITVIILISISILSIFLLGSCGKRKKHFYNPELDTWFEMEDIND